MITLIFFWAIATMINYCTFVVNMQWCEVYLLPDVFLVNNPRFVVTLTLLQYNMYNSKYRRRNLVP